METSYRVTLLPSGHQFKVAPGESILRKGLAAGYKLPFSCKQGVCRNCRGKLIEGEADWGEVHPAYLPPELRAHGYIHLCQASAKSDVTIEIRELEGLEGITVKTVPCRIARLEHPADNVTVMHLRLPMNENMNFLAGQHVELQIPGGLRRIYSIASKSSVDGVAALELHIRRVPGGAFTDTVLPKMKERELLKFEGPLGSFYLRTSSKPAIMLASGTGFAPIKSMLETAFDSGLHRERSFTLYWGARSRKDLYMAELPRSWETRYEGFRFVPVLSEPTHACEWTGRTGFVHAAVTEDCADLSGHEVYACGAPPMVAAAQADFTRHAGLPDDAFFADPFLTEADRYRPNTAGEGESS